MKKFNVFIELVNGKTDYILIKHNQIGNATTYIMNNQWIKDESTGMYFNFNEVVKFSIEELVD